MDRRTAMAFGLMALVIIGFSTLQMVLFPPEPTPETEEDRQRRRGRRFQHGGEHLAGHRGW